MGLLVAASLTYTLAGPGASRTVTSLTTTTATSTSVTTATLTSTSVTTTTATLTTISVTTQNITTTTTLTNSSVETVTGPSIGRVINRSYNGWSFTVAFNSLGDSTIYAYVNLTNISGQTQKVNEMSPLVDPVLYCGGGPCGNPGAQVWAWNPPGAKNFTQTFNPGQWEFSGPYPIPVSSVPWYGIPGGNLILSIWPLIGPSGQSLAVNDTIQQTLMINATLFVS